MKRFFTLVIASAVIAFTSSAQQDTWTQKADFGGAVRAYLVGFSIGGKGYLGTGYDGSAFKKDFWEYDPSTNSWSQKADFGGTERFAATGFSIGGKGYIGLGGTGQIYYSVFLKDFWEYDPVSNTWTKKADFGGTARAYAAGFSINDKGYIGTGLDGGFTQDFWEYDPATDTWTEKANFGGIGRISAVGFAINDKGYIGTGTGSNWYKDFWEYNPSTDVWTEKANFGGTGRQGAVGFSIGTKGYIGTGYNAGVSYNDFWEYDPFHDLWTKRSDVPGPARLEAGGFSIGTKGYLGTGWTGPGSELYSDFWEYTPESPTCAAPSDLNVTNITSTSVQLNWNIEETPEFFLVTYHYRNGLTLYERVSGTTSSVTLSNLTPGTIYGWNVRANCYGLKSSPAFGEQFKTPSNKEEQVTNTTESFKLYPNPSNGSFNINLQTGEEINTLATIQILNTLGQTIYTQEGMIENGVLQKEIRLNDATADGMYLVKVIVNNRVYSAQINFQR